MSEPIIADRKPALLTLEPGTYYWCSCGQSQNQPFCNGAHKDTDFKPLQFEITKQQKVALCQCKYTKKSPFCDGSHAQI